MPSSSAPADCAPLHVAASFDRRRTRSGRRRERSACPGARGCRPAGRRHRGPRHASTPAVTPRRRTDGAAVSLRMHPRRKTAGPSAPWRGRLAQPLQGRSDSVLPMGEPRTFDHAGMAPRIGRPLKREPAAGQLAQNSGTVLESKRFAGGGARMVTIGDVASAAGVSRSTASYALSGKRTISPEVRARVAEAVRDLGYTPNAGARALATSRTSVIALLGRFLPDEFAPAMLQYILGVTNRARELGYDTLLVSEDDGAAALQRISSSRMVDGFVLAQRRRERRQTSCTAQRPSQALSRPSRRSQQCRRVRSRLPRRRGVDGGRHARPRAPRADPHLPAVPRDRTRWRIRLAARRSCARARRRTGNDAAQLHRSIRATAGRR